MIQIQGGTLHGVGSLSGALQVSSTGQIAPGNGSIGTLSVSGNASFAGGSLAEYLEPSEVLARATCWLSPAT